MHRQLLFLFINFIAFLMFIKSNSFRRILFSRKIQNLRILWLARLEWVIFMHLMSILIMSSPWDENQREYFNGVILTTSLCCLLSPEIGPEIWLKAFKEVNLNGKEFHLHPLRQGDTACIHRFCLLWLAERLDTGLRLVESDLSLLYWRSVTAIS